MNCNECNVSARTRNISINNIASRYHITNIICNCTKDFYFTQLKAVAPYFILHVQRNICN